MPLADRTSCTAASSLPWGWKSVFSSTQPVPRARPQCPRPAPPLPPRRLLLRQRSSNLAHGGRNAPMRVLSSQGNLVDSYDPALKEHRTVCFLERQAARVLYRGEARQTLPPIQEWRRLTLRTWRRGCSGARTCGRRGASSWPPASPKVRVEALGQEYRGQRLAGLAHEIFLKRGEAEDPGRAGRPVRLRADGRRLRCR